MVRAFNSLSISPHPYPDGGGGGVKVRFPYTPLLKIRWRFNSLDVYLWDRYLRVRLRVMSLLRESQLKGVKKGRDHFEESFF